MGAALAQMLIASAAPTRWPADRANTWYQAQGWLVGANYVPVTASNQIGDVAGGLLRPAAHRR